ncbi:MAG: hypothetical protein OXE75_17795 [bacterium]|nr:hypothetical protein [bacterium]
MSHEAELVTFPVTSPHAFDVQANVQTPLLGGACQSHWIWNLPEPPATRTLADVGDTR